MRIRLSTILPPLAVLFAPLLLPAQDLKEFEKKVTEFTLANGLHFIVVERHEAPVVSFHTYVNAGSVDDPSGETGLAHMFEHMAFKGTETIGTQRLAGREEGAGGRRGDLRPPGGRAQQGPEGRLRATSPRSKRS